MDVRGCLLLPYTGHPDFRTVWLLCRGENPTYPIVESADGRTSVGMVGRD